jgi:aminoglycoside 3-N-acetyltransferase
VDDLGLAGRPLCVHSSLRSFGWVEGGAEAVIRALLEAGCSVLVPAFVYENETNPPGFVPIQRNAWGEDSYPFEPTFSGFRHEPADATPVSADNGAIPQALVRLPGARRGNHPVDSFAAVGPLATELVGRQTAWDVYAPFEALMKHDGAVLLIGVGLDRMTLLHDAERRAGRELLLRWGRRRDGTISAVRVGGCSDGFPRLESVVAPLSAETMVGESRWRAFPAQATVEAASAAIRADPEATWCGNPACARCRDAAAGGPFLAV